MQCVKIDVAQIPQAEVQNLSMTFLGGVKKFYEDPKNLQRFEDWTRNREGQQ